jgi:predicted peroxiredoxin
VAKILVHVTHGPEDATRAALAFLVAKTAIAQGHDVSLFLAGDGVSLLTQEALDSVEGSGTGKLAEHHQALAEAGTPMFVSGMSCKARGITEEDLGGRAEMAMPDVLVRLTVDSDRVLVY